MSLASWALVAVDHANAGNRAAARLYLVFAALAGACLIPAFGLLAGGAGGFDFAAMRAALVAAGLAPDDVDAINLHGTGTRANDAMEDRAVHAIFADRAPASSTKGWSGHTLGASGALEAVIAAICVEDGLVPGCLGVDPADPSFGMDVATQNRATPVRRVLSNSFGFGGTNASLILRRCDA